uniref:Osteoclast-stimulating factor 1 n=1 Tax=Poecilia mexicana TaxID=48701 RepID=A0A3B3Z341_9TELE
MSDGGVCGQLLVKARFAFQPTNEDELSFSKGDVICVTKQVEGGWWEGSLNDKTGWFPSNYVRELKGADKPKCGTLKSPPKSLDTTIISKTYYNMVSISVCQEIRPPIVLTNVYLTCQLKVFYQKLDVWLK